MSRRADNTDQNWEGWGELITPTRTEKGEESWWHQPELRRVWRADDTNQNWEGWGELTTPTGTEKGEESWRHRPELRRVRRADDTNQNWDEWGELTTQTRTEKGEESWWHRPEVRRVRRANDTTRNWEGWQGLVTLSTSALKSCHTTLATKTWVTYSDTHLTQVLWASFCFRLLWWGGLVTPTENEKGREGW